MKRHWALLAAACAFLVALFGGIRAYSQFFETVTVLVATSEVPAGTHLDTASSFFVRKEIPKGAVSDDALSNMEQLSGWAIKPIFPGQYVVRQQVSPLPPLGRVAAAIDESHEIMGITTSLSGAVGGAIGPGSRVNVYAYCACKERKPALGPPGAIADPPLSSEPTLVLNSMEVVDLRSGSGQTLDPESQTPKAEGKADEEGAAPERVPAVVLVKATPEEIRLLLGAMERKDLFHLTLVGVAQS